MRFYLAPIDHGFGVQCIPANYAHFKVALGCCHVHPTRGALLAAGNGAADMERQDEHPPNDQRANSASSKTGSCTVTIRNGLSRHCLQAHSLTNLIDCLLRCLLHEVGVTAGRLSALVA